MNIPEEAIEKAARSLFERTYPSLDWRDDYKSDSTDVEASFVRDARAALSAVDHLSKHLTDAECAAHAWQLCAAYLSPAFASDMGIPGRLDQYETWHRFATHPHAFKEQP